MNRLATPLISLALALLAWLYMHGRSREIIDDYPVPVEVRLAPGQVDRYVMEFSGPAQVRLSFSGPRSQMRKLRERLRDGDVKFRRTVSVPEDQAAEAVVEQILRFEPAELGLPHGIQVDVVGGRDKVRVVLRQQVERRLRVQVRHTAADRVERLVVEPDTVLVRGPKDVLERQLQIPTQLFVVPESGNGTVPTAPEKPLQVPVVTHLEGQPVQVTPPEVSVTYRLRPKEKVYTVKDVPVRFLCPAGFAYRPEFISPASGTVTVKVRGPAAEGQPAVIAFVDLTSRKFEPGSYHKEPVKVRLPRGFRLEDEPGKVSFRLTKP